jgi:hypothetical protein
MKLDPKIKASEVAKAFGISAQYFVNCIKAARDPRFQRSQRIPDKRLKSLPLNGWHQDTNRWVIKQSDLEAQL